MKLVVEVSYVAYNSHTIELPEGKTWDDVENFWVKWDTVNIVFRGEDTPHSYEMGSGDPDRIDFKHPETLWVYTASEDGDADYDKLLYDQGN